MRFVKSKICNGAKLGPLILLECQECQETYHPLCHQPPVVDVDVYDPRFVWRCRRCVETSSAISTKVKLLEKGSVEEEIRRNDAMKDVIKENANISGLRVPGTRSGDLSKKNGTLIERYIKHMYIDINKFDFISKSYEYPNNLLIWECILTDLNIKNIIYFNVKENQ